MKTLFFVTFLIILSTFLAATIINIPDDQPTIQEGINAAVDGDTVLVHPGDYLEIINFNGKNIAVGSLFLTTADSSYIESTVIHYATNYPYVVRIENDENSSAQLIGFNINNSSKGVLCEFSSPQIKYNHISVSTYGIRCDSLSAPLISNNIIENASRSIQISSNSSPHIRENKIFVSDNPASCGIFVGLGSPIIDNNVIIGENSAFSSGIEIAWDSYNVLIIGNIISEVYSGIEIHGDTSSDIINNLIFNCSKGVMCYESDVRLINNTIVNNSNDGFLCTWNYNPEIINSIIWGNFPNINFDAQVSFNNSCIGGGIPNNSIDLCGNTSRNPCFIDSADYNLSVFSPCIDAGIIDTTSLNLPEYDLAGNDRIQDGNGDNILIIDMGCYEAETVTDPGFISGTISLNGGTGNVEDVNVGVGAPVHPDENGDYLITIGASDSPYNVTAWIDFYYPQTIYNVPLEPGQTTENIDFELFHYEPEDILTISPDSLTYLTIDEVINGHEVKLKNMSCFDIQISGLFTNTFFFYYYPDDLFPYELSQNDSLLFTFYMAIPIYFSRSIAYDTLYIETNQYMYSIPIIYDTDFVDVSDDVISANHTNLYQNYPNPFNPATTFYFSIPEETNVDLSIYNIKGQHVKTLVNDIKPAGEHSIIWDRSDNNKIPVSSGVYFYKLNVNSKTEAVKKCLLLK